MTPNKYKAIIKASGGITNAKLRRLRGDRPQPLKTEDERLLTKAWKNTRKPNEAREKNEQAREKQPA